MSRCVPVALAVAAFVLASTLSASPQPPANGAGQLVILSARAGAIDVEIRGLRFGPAPRAWLDGEELDVLASDETSILAELPATAPGTHRLAIVGGSGATRRDEMDVTIGAVGATGAVGPTGSTGTVGAMGATGSTGPTGVAGATGASGATGSAGPTGATGVGGVSGATGPVGATGATGVGGATGAVGSTGAIGPTGATGVDGASGATGAVGPTGATGNVGASGATGVAGATGATGTQGIDGVTGPAGPPGIAGPTGAQGPTGTAGTTGQSSTTVFGTATLVTHVGDATFTLVPGLTQSITVPASSVVVVTACGGFHTTSGSSTGGSVADVALFVDGVQQRGGLRCFAANNVGLGADAVVGWTLSIALQTTDFTGSGPHVVDVRGRGVDAAGAGEANGELSSGPNPTHLRQGSLTITVLGR